MSRQTEEEKLQVAVASYLRIAIKPGACIWTHIGHGGIRDKATAGKMKAAGLNPGWPDLLFLLWGGRTLSIELKAAKGVQSDAQKEFQAAAAALYHPYHVCRSITQVEAVLQAHEIPLRATVAA